LAGVEMEQKLARFAVEFDSEAEPDRLRKAG
jgi:hypothetical protein